jgi:uncharacterized membrane protein YfcA
VASLIHVAPAGYLVVLVAVTFGSLVQGSVGFGANMVAAPVLAVVEPRALPAALMLPVLPLTLAMMRRERHGVDWRSVGWLMAGRVPGTVAGSLVVAAVAAETLSVLAGIAVLVAVGASLLSTTIPVTPGTEVATGVVSGAMGTATSIGGPPLALLYQHHEGPVLRATLAATFALGTGLSVVGLALAGAIEAWHVWLAAALLPGTLAGVAASNRLVGRVDGAWLRPAVLVFASLAAALAVLRGLA